MSRHVHVVGKADVVARGCMRERRGVRGEVEESMQAIRRNEELVAGNEEKEEKGCGRTNIFIWSFM